MHREDQGKETTEETVALMIRNEARLLCYAGEETSEDPQMGGRHPALQTALPPWLHLGVALRDQSENSMPIKIQAVVSFEPLRNKALEFNLCLFFFPPPRPPPPK